MNEVLSTTAGVPGGEAAFPVGSWERPDPAGIVRRGKAVRFAHYVERYGESPACFVGFGPGGECERPAAMEVYGLHMCRPHGEEAASGALEEVAYDLEQELQRPMNPHVRRLGAHLNFALRRGLESVAAEAGDHERAEAALLEAFPLDHGRVCLETLGFVRDPDHYLDREFPSDFYLGHRLLLHHHMRLAFEEGADWLVEMLEQERQNVAAQAAYALALEREAGLRPPPEDGETS